MRKTLCYQALCEARGKLRTKLSTESVRNFGLHGLPQNGAKVNILSESMAWPFGLPIAHNVVHRKCAEKGGKSTATFLRIR
ncbi:MAG: hypothetical protein V4508_14785 [Pseudomonadota bacterium]